MYSAWSFSPLPNVLGRLLPTTKEPSLLPTRVLIPPSTRFSSLTLKVISRPFWNESGPLLVSIKTPTLLKQPSCSSLTLISWDLRTTCWKSWASKSSLIVLMTRSSFVRPRPSTWIFSTFACETSNSTLLIVIQKECFYFYSCEIDRCITLSGSFFCVLHKLKENVNFLTRWSNDIKFRPCLLVQSFH